MNGLRVSWFGRDGRWIVGLQAGLDRIVVWRRAFH